MRPQGDRCVYLRDHSVSLTIIWDVRAGNAGAHKHTKIESLNTELSPAVWTVNRPVNAFRRHAQALERLRTASMDNDQPETFAVGATRADGAAVPADTIASQLRIDLASRHTLI